MIDDSFCIDDNLKDASYADNITPYATMQNYNE